jgi:hypothetical protein
MHPGTIVRTCIVHLIRNSLAFVSWQDRKTIVQDLKAIYWAENAKAVAGLTRWKRNGANLSDDRAGLAAGLGSHGTSGRPPAGAPQADVNDQRRRWHCD